MPRDDGAGFTMDDKPKETWPEIDMSMLKLNRRKPPAFPLQVLGPDWSRWVTEAAEGAACQVDYVCAPLLSLASTLIGNARWPQATPAWFEPPHLWCCAVGDSGHSKSNGADILSKRIVKELEARMGRDWPDFIREWRAAHEVIKAKHTQWEHDVKEAVKKGNPPPQAPLEDDEDAPKKPKIRQNDVTVEQVAVLLAQACPKGLWVIRDELAGWLLGLNNYNDSGRAFWIEGYGGRPYRVERKTSKCIDVPYLVTALYGTTQPDKLAALFNDPDDGLFSRVCWFWPDPIKFRLGRSQVSIDWAIDALDRLRMLEMARLEDGLSPVYVSMDPNVWDDLEVFCQGMRELQMEAGPLMRSAFGKTQGLVLRLSLVLEYMLWCARPGFAPPPNVITHKAFEAAATLVASYIMPMAERVYGDAAIPVEEKNATTLARWIVKKKVPEVHVRRLQREIRLPGLRRADDIKEACGLLVEAGWLREPRVGFGKDRKVGYGVNPELWVKLEEENRNAMHS